MPLVLTRQPLEFLGARLYTGPLYVKYNAVLRGYPEVRVGGRLDLPNGGSWQEDNRLGSAPRAASLASISPSVSARLAWPTRRA